MDLEAEWAGITLATYAGGDVVREFRLVGVPAVQPAAGLRALAAGVFNRGNVAHRVSFVCTRPPFASPEACSQFQADHALAFLAITGNGDFEFSLGAKDYALHAAVVTRREPVEFFGTTVAYAYEITGGELEDVTPP